MKSERGTVMEWSSVVSRLRLRVAISRQWHTALLVIVAVTLGTIACNDSDRPTSPSTGAPGNVTTAPAETTGLIEGTVRDADGAVEGSLVEVTASPGGSATTGTAGTFSFRLPVGITRLRASKSGYYSRETDVIVQAGATAPVGFVLERFAASQPPLQPPFTVRGVVRNGRGALVPGAEVWIYGNNSPIDNRYGVGFTDNTGHYTVSSPQRLPQAVRAMKDAHIPRDVSILSAPEGSTWTVDVVLVHIDRYTLLPIPPLTVGQSVQLEAQTDLDDASTKRGFLVMQLTSSNPSVLLAEHTGRVHAMAAGTATVTATYYGATTALQIRVEASE
jgi:hypothetical protein